MASSRSKLTRLPARLRQIADFVLPGQPVADVGSHHGLVPVWLVLQARVPSAIAMDLSEEAVTGTRALVDRTPGLGGRVQVRQSDGMAALSPSDGVGTLVVSGLGGGTIGSILQAAAPGALASLGRGVFQPNIGAPALRATLCALGWVIVDEEVTLCGGRFYQVIAAQPLAAAAAPPPPLDEADLLFGPVLRRRRPAAWLEMLRGQEAKWARVAERVARASAEPQPQPQPQPQLHLTSSHARRAADVAGMLARIRMEIVGGDQMVVEDTV